ncbi:MAG: hypothetical protein U0270_35115 [Labilithrix sp.]
MSPTFFTKRRIGSLVFLAFGLGVAMWLGQNGPQEQHVHVILNERAPIVTGVSLQYVGANGDVANETSFHYRPGQAPRIVSHDPRIPSGEYRLRVDVDTTQADSPDSRKSVEKQVTLKGGSAQVDVSRQ